MIVECPKCHKTVQRTARKPIERALSYVIPVSRYTCYNHACRWSGLIVNWDAHPLLNRDENVQ